MEMLEKLKIEMVERVKNIASKLLRNKEMELVDVTYTREGSVMVLRVVVDKKGGITVDECAWVNEQLGKRLDVENFLIESYTLEVNSPGLDRLLKTKKDFERVAGSLVKVHTHVPLEDKKEHVGKVIHCDDEHLMIELHDTSAKRKIPLNKIAKARLAIEF
jgi:ribosome maturation factor RimP